MLQVHHPGSKAPMSGCFICAVTGSNSAKAMTKYTLYPCYFPPEEFDNIQVRILHSLKPRTHILKLPIVQFIYHGSYGGAFRARPLGCNSNYGSMSSVVIKRLDLHAVPAKQYAKHPFWGQMSDTMCMYKLLVREKTILQRLLHPRVSSILRTSVPSPIPFFCIFWLFCFIPNSKALCQLHGSL